MTAKRSSPWSPAPPAPEPGPAELEQVEPQPVDATPAASEAAEPEQLESLPVAPALAESGPPDGRAKAKAPTGAPSPWSPAAAPALAPSPWSPAASPALAPVHSQPPPEAEQRTPAPAEPAPTSTSWFDGHASEPSASVTSTAALWCRACGLPQVGGDTCQGCGWALDVPESPQSYVGLVFAVPGKLLVNKKRGVCIAADAQSLQLHFSAEDSQVVPLSGQPSFDEAWSRPDLSPSARLQQAARQLQAGEVKAAWDAPTLFQLAGSWANVSVAAMRQLADEALAMGWPEVFEWVGLGPAEKSWRRAHDAAVTGDADGVRRHLADLPTTGFPARIRLCLLQLGQIRDHPDDWRTVVESAIAAADADAPSGADLLTAALDGAPQAALRQFGQAIVERGHLERGRYWQDAADRLREGVPGLPPDQPHVAWTALARYLNRAEVFPAERVRQLTPTLIDDLIDAGSLDPATSFGHFDETDRSYLEARLRPETLSVDVLKQAEHYHELARRSFLLGDASQLDQLPGGSTVDHYRELFSVALGRPVTFSNLRADTRAALEATVEAQRSVHGDDLIVLPIEVVWDPSLWSLFIEPAKRGNIKVTEEQRGGAPRYADWVALHHLAGLVADAAMEQAVEVGLPLVRSAADPARRAEAASLTAAALDALDRSAEAYELVEASLAEHYSQGLWLNAAILAERARPEAAAHYWTHLARELPAPDSWAALLRGLNAHNPHKNGLWPNEWVAVAATVLAECDVDTYGRILGLAVHGSPRLVADLPQRGGDFDQPRMLCVGLARGFEQRPVSSDDVMTSFTGVPDVDRSESWFSRELERQADVVIGRLLDSFSDAGSESVIALGFAGGDLATWLRPGQVYSLSCLGFARMECGLLADDEWMAHSAYQQWIFDPLTEFSDIELPAAPAWAGDVSEAFSRAIHVAIRTRLTTVTQLGHQIERSSRTEMLGGRRSHLEVEGARRSDVRDLEPHLELGESCLRWMRLLTTENAVRHSTRIREIEDAIAALRDLVDEYGRH